VDASSSLVAEHPVFGRGDDEGDAGGYEGAEGPEAGEGETGWVDEGKRA